MFFQLNESRISIRLKMCVREKEGGRGSGGRGRRERNFEKPDRFMEKDMEFIGIKEKVLRELDYQRHHESEQGQE